METIFRKVAVSERLPEFGQRVIALVLEQNDLGISKFLWNVSYSDITKSFKMDGNTVQIEYWLEEIPFENNETNYDCCDNPDIQWNKVDISVGDKKGSSKDLSYNYCNNCGATFNEEID